MMKDMTLDANSAMDRCQDFMDETTELQEIFRLRGHICVTSVRCHPELAGCGLEYSWGKLKLDYRRWNSNGANVKSSIRSRLEALQMSTSLPRERCWKYERKARDYRRMYLELNKQIGNADVKLEDVCYKALEKMLKKQKSHRNIMELDRVFIDDEAADVLPAGLAMDVEVAAPLAPVAPIFIAGVVVIGQGVLTVLVKNGEKSKEN